MHDVVTRRLAHEPFGCRPTTLLVDVRRYRCTGCGHVWRQDTSKAAAPRAKISRAGLSWAQLALVVHHLTVARIAQVLAVAWDTANHAVLAEGKRVLIADPARFDGVAVIGVGEHVWRHTRKGDKYVTVIIDLTPIRDGTGPARLLDMVEGRSKSAFKTWLTEPPQAWRDGGQVVAMDGFTGFKTAAVSLWLNAGVPPTQVAEWAGHSVNVLLRVYAACVVGQDEVARLRVAQALGTAGTSSPVPPGQPHTADLSHPQPDTPDTDDEGP